MARFVYLISPKRIDNKFYIELSKVLKSKKVKYFQLRLKGQKDKHVLNILKKVKGPFNTTAFAQNLAILALKDQEHINNVVMTNSEVKSWFETELKKLNLFTSPSEGNFSFVQATEKKAKEISNHLIQSGILVRQLNSYNLPNCLRITIGTKTEMEATINCLKNFK